MATLAHQPHPFRARRALRLDLGRAGLPLFLAVLLALMTGGLLGPQGASTVWQVLALLGLVVADVSLISRRLAEETAKSKGFAFVDDVAAGAFALITLLVALRYTGALQNDLYPLTFVVVAYLSAVSRPTVSGVLLGLLVGAEVLFYGAGQSVGLEGHGVAPLVFRIGFFVLFATLAIAFHKVAAFKDQRQEAAREQRQASRIQHREQELRLSSSPESSADREAARGRLVADAVGACERASYHTLNVLKHGVRARTAVLLWADLEGRELTVRELVSDSDLVVERSIPAGSGVIGGITQRREPLNLPHLRPSYRGITYYQGPEKVGAFLGVPVLEDGELRGVLCVDRAEDVPFTAHDEQILVDAAEQIVHTVANERLFIDIEQTRYELSQFYEASRALANATNLEGVFEASLQTVRRLAAFDLAAITLFDAGTGLHTVAKAIGEGVEHLQGVSFQPNSGLVAMAVNLRHYLPVGGDHRNHRAHTFDRDTRLKGIQSLVVLPLIVQERAIGTLVLGTEAANAFSRERREMLEVVANQVAVAIENAQSYARLEELATTDGLTKLLNRRTFLDRLDVALKRAERSQAESTFILTDIDFFKKVNDNHGHPMGDEVLRQIAKVFQDTLRCTDLVGRYGGEEFVILLENTDLEGGVQMAERLRNAVADLRFESEQGPFQVTVSLGLSSYPNDSKLQEPLIDMADQALYACKHAGRNCTKTFAEL
ncbi:MAG: hypothetical protein AUK47_23250 [Deltaproteobacteria bacterium CG2_30_63_29]|nr:MAG: hypothetical protein AUK47_23250 [Deltaproteobacteria bacterium CG2_30_63_29]PIW01013.1 MAG: hypothetical protein COW42_06235 [Deltaproteobacteria bacterium CG17_big_fil_post_rev_8_21_14_2_50_63_7]PJB46525.1 MAG: hypothetical protein CO108_05715 [Deltaproteobacteria bacterium CG_4_9_14_3_um_filter_63_12]